MTWQEGIGAAAREMRLGGSVVLGSGNEVTLDGDYVTSVTIREGADGAIEPGDVLSGEITLDISREAFSPDALIGATLMPQLGLVAGDEILWQPLGVFIIESAMYLEQQGLLRIKGADAVSSELSETFSDSAAAYPMTLARLWQRVVAQTRFSHSGDIPNGDAIIDALPAWDGASVRSVLGCVAAAAGCFVRLGREGDMQLVPLWSDEVRQISADHYYTLQADAATYGPVDALRVTFREDGEEIEKTWCTGESAVHTIDVTGNPLFVYGAAHLDELAQGMLARLAGYTGGAATFEWQGDPLLNVGERIEINDAHGGRFSGVLSRHTLSFSGAFRAECRCAIPDGADSGVRRAITPEGRLNAAALTGALNGAIISAGSVSTSKLAAGAVTAEKIAAGALDAMTVEAVRAKLGDITAANIATDTLAAQLIRLQQLIAGTATFDAATVGHLVAEALNLEFGSAGNVFITNLAVSYAQLVGATIGKLVIRASDGNYYRMDVAADGTVTATKAEISDAEQAQGETEDGRIIAETQITAEQLSTGNLLATYALINRIDAARIDVDQLFARQAFTDRLYTSEIFGGKSLRLLSFHDAAEPPALSEVFEGYRWLDTGTVPNLMRIWQGRETTPAGMPMDTGRSFVESAEGAYPAVDTATWLPALDEAYLEIIGRDHAYLEKDDGTVVKLTFPETIYGGTISADGTGTKTYKLYTIDANALNGYNDAKHNWFSVYSLWEWIGAADDDNYVCDAAPIKNWSEVGGEYQIAVPTVWDTGGSVWGIAVPKSCLGLSDDYVAESNEAAAALVVEYLTAHPIHMAVKMATATTFTATVEAAEKTFTLDNAKGQIISDVVLTLTDAAVTVNGTEYAADTLRFTPEAGAVYKIVSTGSFTAVYTCSGWRTINDTSSISEKADEAYAKSQYLELRSDGTHIRATGTDNELVLTNEGLHVDVGGQEYSRFAAGYVQFGNYRLRRTADGGLAFKLVTSG